MVDRGIRAILAVLGLSLGVVALCSVARAQSSPLEEREIGRWRLAATAEDAPNNAICTVSSRNEKGELFGFRVDSASHEWALAIGGRELRLGKSFYGDGLSAGYAIDGNEPGFITALPLSNRSVVIPLGADFKMTEGFRRGDRIEILTENARLSFSLAGSGAALDALADCARQHLGFKESLTAEFPTRIKVANEEDYAAIAIGDWFVDAGDRDGHFASCFTTRRSGAADFSISLERDGIVDMHVGAKTLDLPLHQDHAVRFSVDGQPAGVLQGRSFWHDSVSLELSKQRSILEAMRNGKRLQVEIDDHKLAYELEGFGSAFSAVERCVAHYTAETDPFSDAPVQQSSATPTPTVAGTEPPNDKAVTAPQPEMVERSVAGWTLTVSGAELGKKTCQVTRKDELGPLLGVTMQSPAGLVFLTLSDDTWQLTKEADYEVRYLIDGGTPVPVMAHAVSETMMVLVLGADLSATEPLRLAKTLDFRAPDTIGLFNLAGSQEALDALRDCADWTRGSNEVTPTPATRSKPGAPISAKGPEDRSRNEAGAVARQVDNAIVALREHPFGKVILEHDPAAESALRSSLQAAVASKPADQWLQTVTGVLGRFMRVHLADAVRIAPPEALAILVRQDRDMVHSLKAQPPDCAVFFTAITSGNLGILPEQRRDAQVERYAALMAAAYARPLPEPGFLPLQQLADTLAEAYIAQGFSTDDIAAMDNLKKLEDHEVCRLADVYLSSVAALEDDKAGGIYRTFVWSSIQALEQPGP
jgi:hypothetical protein